MGPQCVVLRRNDAQGQLRSLNPKEALFYRAAGTLCHNKGVTSSVSWKIPKIGNRSFHHLSVGPGQVAALVGPNGAGKSSLIYWLNKQASNTPINRVVAHRRIWLESAGPALTSSERARYSQMISHHESQPNSRISGTYEKQRSSSLLYDLMGRENGRNSRYVRLHESGQSAESVEPSLLTTISNIMKAAGLNFHFAINDEMEFDVVKGASRYPISAMSDGEKAALLLSADVLLAESGSVQLLDEPERHLHRSISATLILALFEARPDCGFVISTHDLDLVQRLDRGSTTVHRVQEVEWSSEGDPLGWEIHGMPEGMPIDDDVRRAVLGGRERVLFVEGSSQSLDAPLLAILFPEWSIVPLGGSDEVQRAVHGLNTADGFHWVSAAGIIDGDARTDGEIQKLQEKNILVLPVNEIENLYYLPWVVRAQAIRQGEYLDKDSNSLIESAESEALKSLEKSEVLENLAAVNAEKIIRRRALADLPPKNSLKEVGSSISLNLSSPYEEQLDLLKESIREKDLELIVKNYSIRDSGYLHAVSRALGYQNIGDYQAAVRVMLKKDEISLGKLIKFVHPDLNH